jgi:monothiol glutaredoxin
MCFVAWPRLWTGAKPQRSRGHSPLQRGHARGSKIIHANGIFAIQGVLMSDVHQRIDQLVKDNDIVLFMKGNASFPMCGFSGRAIQFLKASGVDTKTLTTVNVLDDADIRQGIKEYSNWPTIPQLYIKGEFIGGSDIMTEMYESGELTKVLGN